MAGSGDNTGNAGNTGDVGGDRAGHTRPWSALAWGAPLAALVAVMWTVYIAPLPHYDVEVFLRAGAAVGHGRNPYPLPGSAEVYSGFAYVYPYLVAFGFVPLSWLGGFGATVFIALSVGALFLGTRLVGTRDRHTYALVMMASCAITGLQMGTLNAVLFLGLTALWRYRDHPITAGVLAAGVIYAKLFLAPVWLWLVLTRRTKASAVAAAGVGLLLAVTELTSPVDTRTYLGMLTLLAREEAPLGLSLTGLLVNTGLDMGVATWAARAVAAAVLAGSWLHMRRSGDERVPYAGALAAALVASPIVWSHYLLLLLAPILVIAPRSRIPLAVFTAGSWFVVTPHRTSLTGFVAGGVIIGVLAAPVVGCVVKTLTHRGSVGGGPEASRPAPAAMTPVASGVAIVAVTTTVVGVGFGIELLATTYGNPHRVIGAYCALLGVLAVLGWSLRQQPGHGWHCGQTATIASTGRPDDPESPGRDRGSFDRRRFPSA